MDAVSAPVDTGIESTVTGSRRRRYEALVQSYSAELYRHAYWLCSDKAVAEDLIQEVFCLAGVCDPPA